MKGLIPNDLKFVIEILKPRPNKASNIKYFDIMDAPLIITSQLPRRFTGIKISPKLLITAKKIKKIINDGRRFE